MDFESSQVQLIILVFKYAMEYEKDMLSRYREYKKRVTLSEVKRIVEKLEQESHERMKKLQEAIKKLNLEQMNQSVDTLDDAEALKELIRYQNTGHIMYSDYILRVHNPYAREVFKQLKDSTFGYIEMIERETIKLTTLPSVNEEIYPVN